jgi:hypothetical protein
VGANNNFDAVYSLGNHCYGAGDEFIFNKLKNAPVTTVLSNVNLAKSPLVSGLMENHKNFVKSQEYEIQDDKNPDLKHKVLFMGLTVPSLGGRLENTEIYDNGTKREIHITENDLQTTFASLQNQVNEFKERNPKGAVILLSHAGLPVAKMLGQNVQGINVILNGHDHRKDDQYDNNTLIASLGQDNEMLKAVNIKFGDNGELESVKVNTLEVGKERDKATQAELEKVLGDDVRALIKLNGEELKYDDFIRYSNSHLMNYLTTAVFEEAKKDHPALDILGIPSNNVRKGLEDGSNNIDLMQVFDGASGAGAVLGKASLTGKELGFIINKNIENNLKSPTRSALVQWSDIQIDRTSAQNGQWDDIIKMRNKETGEFEPLNQNARYEVILPARFLKDFPEITAGFEPLDKTFNEYLMQSLKSDDFEINVTDKIREQRVK